MNLTEAYRAENVLITPRTLKYTFKTADKKGAEQTARIRKLVRAFDVRMQQSEV